MCKNCAHLLQCIVMPTWSAWSLLTQQLRLMYMKMQSMHILERLRLLWALWADTPCRGNPNSFKKLREGMSSANHPLFSAHMLPNWRFADLLASNASLKSFLSCTISYEEAGHKHISNLKNHSYWLAEIAHCPASTEPNIVIGMLKTSDRGHWQWMHTSTDIVDGLSQVHVKA